MTEKIMTLFFLLGSIVYLLGAHQLAFGTLGAPKSGFLPMLVGIVGVMLVLAVMIKQRQEKKVAQQDKADWTKFCFIIIGLLFYMIALNIIGYFATTFIFLFYLFKVMDTVGWIVPCMAAAGSSLVFHVIFARFLTVTLP